MKKIVIGADHRGFNLKESLKSFLTSKGYEVIDTGTYSTEPADYPDIAAGIVKKIISGEAQRGIMVCGSGVGASVAANKFKGIRAAVCHDTFSAHQGVEDDSMNMLCLGGGIIGESVAKEVVIAFVEAEFKSVERYIKRLEKVKKFEEEN